MRGYEEKLITKICVLGNKTLSILLMVAQYRQQNVNWYTQGVNCYVHYTSVYGNELHVKVHMKSLSLAFVFLFSTNEPKVSCLWTFEVTSVCEETDNLKSNSQNLTRAWHFLSYGLSMEN